ncbi:MAG: hypothetical protein FWG14_11600 [Peptococcaceae bacterium]|nr:hypothetical protein [Peptococcaceae bacterium]
MKGEHPLFHVLDKSAGFSMEITSCSLMPVSKSKLSRVALMALGIIASLSLVVCALCYIVAPVPIDGLGGFLPDSGEADPSRSWLTGAYAAGLVAYALATAPIVAVCAVRCYRLNPILVVMAAAWLELSFVLELLNNLPLIARFLMPPTATPVGLDNEALTYLAQLDTLDYLASDVPGFMLAYVGLTILSVVVYRHSRGLAIITAASFALFLANIPFLWFEPKILACLLLGLAVLAFAGFPFTMVRISLHSTDRTRTPRIKRKPEQR